MRNVTTVGGDLAIYINGRLYGVTSEVRWEQSYGRHTIYGIDSVTPFELAPGQTNLQGSMSIFRLHNDAGIEGLGIAPRDYKLPRERYFSLQVVDRITDTVVLQVNRCAVTNQAWSVAATNVLQGTFSFTGIGWANEFGED